MRNIRIVCFVLVFSGVVTFCYAEVDPTASISFAANSPTAGGDGAKNQGTVTGTGTYVLNTPTFSFSSAQIRVFTKDGKTEIGRGMDTKGAGNAWTATASKLGKGQYKAACALLYYTGWFGIVETYQNPVSVDVEIK